MGEGEGGFHEKNSKFCGGLQVIHGVTHQYAGWHSS